MHSAMGSLINQTKQLLANIFCVGKPQLSSPPLSSLSSLEWDEVYKLAQVLGIQSQLYHRIMERKETHLLPPNVLETLQKDSAQVWARNIAHFTQFADVLRAWENHNIQAVLLKGVHILFDVYKKVGIRGMGDVDVLIHENDIPAATQILANLGFSCDQNIEFLMRQHFHSEWLRTIKPAQRFRIEVHWQLVLPCSSLNLNIEALWTRVRPITILGQKAFVLAPEDFLVHQCLHAVELHLLLGTFRLVYDIAATIIRYNKSLDWYALTNRAYACGGQRYVCLGLLLAKDVLDAPVPQTILEMLGSRDMDINILELAKDIIFQDAREYLLVPPALFPIEAFVTAGALINVPDHTKSEHLMTGKVVTLNGQPVPGALVHCVSRHFISHVKTITDQNGFFQCTMPAHVRSVAFLAEKGNNTSLVHAFFSTASDASQCITLTLYPTVGIKGTVVDRDKNPLPNARVTASPIQICIIPNDIPTAASFCPIEPIAMTSETGTFEIPKLLPGRYRLTCESKSHMVMSLELNIDESESDKMIMIDMQQT